MTNPNDPAYPEILELKEYTKEGGDVRYFRGLTKREYFAIKAFAANIAGRYASGNQSLIVQTTTEDIANESIKCADALIAELNKEAKP